MFTSRLYASLNNTQSQQKLERISSLAKDTRIKSLEDLVIKSRYNPKYVKEEEVLVKSKDIDIVTLRKQLKLSTIENPQVEEAGEMEKQKEDIFQIVIEQKSQIREMEVELEKLIREKDKQHNWP